MTSNIKGIIFLLGESPVLDYKTRFYVTANQSIFVL